jgi:adenylate cyclase class 2
MEFKEREVKFYLQNLPEIEERLKLCGAELVQERIFEKNIRLDTADHNLMKEGRLLRLRQDKKVRVTYKADAKVEDGVIARTEIEFTADDLGVVKMLFEALGYQATVVYEKYRSVYQLGDVQVMLDELPFGDFIEIEAPNNVLIEGVAQMLGLNWSRAINTNYLGLWQTAKMRTGLKFNDLTFENLQDFPIKPSTLGVEPADPE